MVLAGFVAGVSSAGLFNLWDRALFLSVLHARPFLSRDNFRSPYQGFLQVIFQRTLSSGLYFPLFDAAQPVVRDFVADYVMPRHHHRSGPDAARTAAEQSALVHCICGNIAGGVSGVMLNGLTAIKYDSWNSHTPFFQTARRMYSAGGLKPFTKGIGATVVRDSIFGGVFALTKLQMARALQPLIRVPEEVHEADEHHAGSDTAIVSHDSHAAHHHLPILPLSKSTQQVLHAKIAALHRHSSLVEVSDASSPNPVAVNLVPASSSAHVAPSHAEPSTPLVQLSAGTVDFTAALLAGALATIASSPLNYLSLIHI